MSLYTIHAGLVLYQTASSTFGTGSGPVFFSNIGCSGSEQHLLECPKTVFVGTYCTHSRDVGLKCERKLHSSTTIALIIATLIACSFDW